MNSTVTPTRAAIARSWLLVPARSSEELDRAAKSPADVVVLDLEDGVPPSGKAAARVVAREWLRHRRGWLRINSRTSPSWRDDLESLHDLEGVEGVVLAKSESPDEVAATADALGGAVPLIALVESARGIARAAEIAASPHVVRLAFGRGDFRRDTGIADTPLALAHARSQLVIASRLADIAAPIDGPCLSTDPTRILADAAITAEMGMTGKLCLRPEQASITNDALSPTDDEVTWAEQVVARLGASGSGIENGSDLPALQRARNLLSLRAQLDSMW